MPNTTAPVYELETYDFSTEAWTKVETYDTANDSRAEGDAYFAYDIHVEGGPTRLMKDGVRCLGYDTPDDYYAADLY
ncbi:hypothetical protein ACWGH4_00005 [Streptomyces sp. NPDC054847]